MTPEGETIIWTTPHLVIPQRVVFRHPAIREAATKPGDRLGRDVLAPVQKKVPQVSHALEVAHSGVCKPKVASKIEALQLSENSQNSQTVVRESVTGRETQVLDVLPPYQMLKATISDVRIRSQEQ